MTLIDTNIILRYLLNDHPEMSGKSKEILQNDSVMILTQVVAEAVYVLGGVYHSGRAEIAAALHEVFSLENVQIENEEITILAVDEYARSNLDFVDLLLYAHHSVAGLDVKTFDKGLLRKIQSSADDTR